MHKITPLRSVYLTCQPSNILHRIPIEMGNCLMSRHRVTAQEEIEKDPGRGSMALEKKEKRVRFLLDDHVRDDSRAREDKDGLDGVVRLRVVVTKEELKRILSGSDRCVDDLLSALRLRSRSVVISYGSGDGNGIGGNCWRPALESIPEDH